MSGHDSSSLTAQHHYQHGPSDGRKHNWVSDRGFLQEKFHLCSSQEDETLRAENKGAALCHFWGSRRAGIQPGSLSTECVSINCNSNFSLWKLTLNWKQHSFASSTQFLQANLAILAVSPFPHSTCIYANVVLVYMSVFLSRVPVLANSVIPSHF